jgi:hypothetical protein
MNCTTWWRPWRVRHSNKATVMMILVARARKITKQCNIWFRINVCITRNSDPQTRWDVRVGARYTVYSSSIELCSRLSNILCSRLLIYTLVTYSFWVLLGFIPRWIHSLFSIREGSITRALRDVIDGKNSRGIILLWCMYLSEMTFTILLSKFFRTFAPASCRHVTVS